MKKNRNYSGRNRIDLIAQNYRYNLIDYLYYQGKRYEKRWPASCSGPIMVPEYWWGMVWFPALFLCLPEWVLTNGYNR